MGREIFVCLLLIVFNFYSSLAQSSAQDAASFKSLVSEWQEKPSNWTGEDPCGNKWVGIECRKNRIISIELSSMGLNGDLTGDIGGLTELQVLDLSYNVGMSGTLPTSIGTLRKLTNLILVGCNFFGDIPDLSGLQELVYLSLNLNKFTGSIPPSIGRLSKLVWLDLADNRLTGPIPISNGSSPGLDQLIHTKHFHFGNNRLSGTIPSQLFSSEMSLIHLLLDNNRLEGSIPSTLGLVQKLEVLRLDGNSLTKSVPANINNLSSIGQLYLSNNQLTGPLPNLTGLVRLSFVDLSNNSFDKSPVPTWFSTFQSLTTINAEFLNIEGPVPAEMFSLPQLQTVRLRDNLLNGTLDISSSDSTTQLKLVDLRNNEIVAIVPGQTNNQYLRLQGNPICNGAEYNYCIVDPIQSTTPYTTLVNCESNPCTSGQDRSPKCNCAYPYMGALNFRAPSFSNLDNSSRYQELESRLMDTFSISINVDSVYLYNITWYPNTYLRIDLKVFPFEESSFTQFEISRLGFILSNQTFKPPSIFGPFFFQGLPYQHFEDLTRPVTSEGSGSKIVLPVIIGASAGGLLLALVIIALIIYGCKQRNLARTAESRGQPFGTWDQSRNNNSPAPQLTGARSFPFNELKRCTNNFSEANELGYGGYGKVYKGVLQNGQLVAVKRAQQQSMQGGHEFKAEIELLSRVHHRNLVRLVGFCYNEGEQILVYDYIPNGSLSASLSGKSGVTLDWRKRLKVVLGSARGLAYLHDLADPPIIHRDVKSSNILLDENLNAKVADFGLCKSLGDGKKTHVTTQVKGTMGYLDPEYYMTQRLTEKSDVYSFGVLMLELATARQPLERGRYIVREVKIKMNRSEDLYGLHELLDPMLVSSSSMVGFEKYIDVALQCLEEQSQNRPTMTEVVKEIEGIVRLAGTNTDSAASSGNYGQSSSNHLGHPYNSHEHIASYESVPTAR